jgi:eukaryotic-like serine/threonine-protein kinase
LQRGALPLPELLKIGVQIADALARAHRLGITHRDLKPEDIMLTKSGAKLMDFGLAKPAGLGPFVIPSSSEALTATMQSPATPISTVGMVVGTIQYMSPEQIEGKEADARSDVFALGAVLYEMATGRRAFEGKTQLSVISAILHQDPRPIASAQPEVSSVLDFAIRTCLAKDPDDRFQTAQDVKLQLNWLLQWPGCRPPYSARACVLQVHK